MRAYRERLEEENERFERECGQMIYGFASLVGVGLIVVFLILGMAK